MSYILPILVFFCVFLSPSIHAREDLTTKHFQQASENAKQAQQAIAASDHYVRGWLRHADPVTGLIPRNLTNSQDFWNGKDSAADNYPFMVLTTWLTDRAMFQGRMQEMLHTELRLTNRRDQLVDAYSFSKRSWHNNEENLDRMIFESSEYCKDGLMPLTEWLGNSPWYVRMLGIINSIWKHAPIETRFGNIPSLNIEVNGEMMQITSRVYWKTGQAHYLDHACRIADYYLLGEHHPTEDFEVLRLRDHGCELISGLTEVYVACHFARPEKASKYRKPLHQLLDRILEVGLDENGMMYNQVNPQTGKVLDSKLSDNWGYNYNGFYAVHLIDSIPRYREATLKALNSLNPHYLAHAWDSSPADGLADSVEGAINLYNREPMPEVADWIDINIQRMLKIQKPDGIVEGWHGDGNFARTAIMYALWKQQGVTIQPWRKDVKLGAVLHQAKLYLHLTSKQPWAGKLHFDSPRHKTILNLPLDYPRINQFPEWFTVEKKVNYRVEDLENRGPTTALGSQLIAGLPIEITKPQQPKLLIIAAEQ